MGLPGWMRLWAHGSAAGSRPPDGLKTHLLSAVADRPWRTLSAGDLGKARLVPSMLSDEELKFYHWIAQQTAASPGAIVDLGAFIGGSTAHLAEGARAAGATDKQVFAFDRFAASEKVKEKQLYPKGIAPFEGQDFLALSEQFLAPWAPRIVFRPGNIQTAKWRGGPISLMVLDASKTADITDHIARVFFPHLVPGQSVIVQQDELHWKEPWIAAQMQNLSQHFVPLCHIPGSAMAYLCVKYVHRRALRRPRVANLSEAKMLDALTASADRLGPFDIMPQIARQKEAVRLNPGRRKSWRFKTRPARKTPRPAS